MDDNKDTSAPLLTKFAIRTPSAERSRTEKPSSSRHADETMSEKASTTCSTTAFTPATTETCTAENNLWSSRGAVPWPSNTYQIVEKHTGLAICIANGEVSLKPAAENTAATHWLCVEKNGYFGFHNPCSGRYLGHDGKNGVRGLATVLKNWELLTPREHPEGGYQILFPYHQHTLMVLCTANDGKSLARRNHGTTLWEFVRV